MSSKKATEYVGGWFFVLLVLVVALRPGHSIADRDHQIRNQAMTTKLVVIVTLQDMEVARFETALSSKESIAFKHEGFDHVLNEGETITFRVPLVLTKI